MSVAYTLAGGYVSLNGVNFDGVQYQAPRRVEYQGPTAKRRVSGALVLEGPVVWTLAWPVMDVDSFQGLYTLWNLHVNDIPNGPLVDFGISDPRNAGAFVAAPYQMEEPKFSMEELFVREVSVRLIEWLP